MNIRLLSTIAITLLLLVPQTLDALEPPPPGPELLKYTPEQIEKAYADRAMPEAVAMYLVIAKGGQLDGNSGWFHPAENRFSWKRLAERFQHDPQQPLTKETFKGDLNIFRQLDRDHDEQLSGFDLDWSDNNSWVRQSAHVQRTFRRIDPSGDGTITKDEWNRFFERVSKQSEAFQMEQFRDALVPPGSGFLPGDMPSKEMLIKGFLQGELGSLQEGPSLDQSAPDFTVRSLQGNQTLRLSERIGSRPVVLCFGNFTCGPFRSMYPLVESIYKRQKHLADFIFVYVREAHPTDGWVMQSNEKVGVSISQPKTFDERKEAAAKCANLLKSEIPFYVDDLNDTVGNLYSAMPARLYVIDPQGTVAYKSGRGPFGFKPEEMEQALLMLHLETKLLLSRVCR